MRAHLTLVAVVVVWAGSFSVIKALLDDGVEALDVAILRYAIAVPGFAFILWWARGLPGLTRGDAARVLVAGVLIVVGYHAFLNIGIAHTTSGVAALVVALAPAMTFVLALGFGVERIRPLSVVGLGVAFAGVALVVALGTGQDLSPQTVQGPLIVLGAPLAFALYNVILKPLLGRYDLLALTAATSFAGTIALLPFVRSSTLDAVADASGGELALLLYLGVLATLLGYIGWNVGLRGLGPTRAVSYTYAISPLAVLIAAVTLDEPLSVWLVVGAALVVLGVALVQRGHAAAAPRVEPDAKMSVWPRGENAPSRGAS